MCVALFALAEADAHLCKELVEAFHAGFVPDVETRGEVG